MELEESNQSVETTIDTTPHETTPKETTETPSFAIPDKYKEAGWTQGLDSQDKVWDKLANAQKVIGKKGILVPDSFDDPDVNKGFYKQIGMPEDHKDYEFAEIEGLSRDEAQAESFKKMMHEAGLNKHQAKSLQQNFDKFILEQQSTKVERDDEKFQTMLTEKFGDESSKVFNNTQLLFKGKLSEETLGAMESMTNEQLMAVTEIGKVFMNERGKYMSEDNQNGGPGGAEAPVETYDSLMAQSREKRKEMYLLDRKDQFYNEKADKINKEANALVDRAFETKNKG